MTAPRLWSDRRGAVALEFAMIAQVFAVIFAGTAEIGIVYLKRLQLSNTLATAANYAMVNPASVSASGSADLAATLGAILVNDGIAAPASAQIVINNGIRRTVTGGTAAAAGTATTSGQAIDADRCYCPTGTAAVAWGAPTTCGSACVSGLRAGKFVELRVSRAHTALFGGFGGVVGGRIAVMSLVQIE